MLSLIVPVYRNETEIEPLMVRLGELNRALVGGFEAVLVVDGSPDSSHARLESLLPGSGIRAQLISLSRNFGSFPAIRAGLRAARGRHYAVMAADLQEPAELFLEMHRQLAAGQCDVVVGARTHRNDPLRQRLAAGVFWTMYRLFVQRDVPRGGVDVFGCNRRFRRELLALPERNTSLVGLIFWLGFRRTEIPYRRLPRRSGRSAWSVRRRVQYLLDSAFSFTHLPIRLLEVTGLLGVALAAILATLVLWAKVNGRIPVPGYSATVIAVVFFGGLNIFGLGLVGEYVWRAFENGKERPAFVISTRRKFLPDGANR